MRKGVYLAFSVLLVCTFLLVSLSPVKANAGSGPTVTPVSGDMNFTTEIVPLNKLPGTVASGESFVPAGYPAGEVQFGGDGVVVKGLNNGTATVCYPIKATEVKQGWGGKIGKWTGAKWESLATTITTPDEVAYGSVCATITGSGTYAFIKYVADVTLLPTNKKCPFIVEPLYYSYGGGYVLSARLIGTLPAEGAIVKFKVLDFAPPGAVWGDMTGTIWHGIWGKQYSDFVFVSVDINTIESAKLYVEYPNCSVVINYDSETELDD